MNLRSLELSDFEKAALEEAKRLDISKLPVVTIDSAATNTAANNDKVSDKTVKKGSGAVGFTKTLLNAAVTGNGKLEEETRKNDLADEKPVVKSMIINEKCRI